MSRPIEWTPLGRSRDPVPGDPLVVEKTGRHYQEVAQTITTAAERLRRIADHEQMTSKAVEAFREKAEQVATDIQKAHQRYQAVGDALVTYAAHLSDAQDTSVEALTKARVAETDKQLADRKAETARTAAETATDPDTRAVQEAAARQAEDDVAAAERELARATGLLATAIELRDRAATAAIALIDPALSSGGLTDNWWDDWGRVTVQWISKISGAVAAVCGILSLVVGWIPVIGQALAAILGTIALIASIISLLANLTLALTGDGSWSAVVLDVISVATFGLGRVASASARLSFQGAKGSARLAAGRLAAQSPGVRSALGLPANASAREVIRRLLKSDDLAALSRRSARRMAKNANRHGRIFSASSTSRSLSSIGTDFTDSLRTVSQRTSWNNIVSKTRTEFSEIVDLARSQQFMPALDRALGEAGIATDFQTLSRMETSLLGQTEVSTSISRAVSSNRTFFLSTAISAGVDSYQLVATGSGSQENGPAQLHVPVPTGSR